MQVPLILTTGLWLGIATVSFSQIDTSQYVPSTISAIIVRHGIDKQLPTLGLEDNIFIPPGWRYQLDLEATGTILELSGESKRALLLWSGLTPSLPDFVRHFTHQVEVQTENGPLWIMWQQVLVKPFQEERSAGGRIRVYAYFAGVFHRQPLFLVTVFESVK